nr:hypothetical protein CFP56_63977 [Quercus suber]
MEWTMIGGGGEVVVQVMFSREKAWCEGVGVSNSGKSRWEAQSTAGGPIDTITYRLSSSVKDDPVVSVTIATIATMKSPPCEIKYDYGGAEEKTAHAGQHSIRVLASDAAVWHIESSEENGSIFIPDLWPYVWPTPRLLNHKKLWNVNNATVHTSRSKRSWISTPESSGYKGNARRIMKIVAAVPFTRCTFKISKLEKKSFAGQGCLLNRYAAHSSAEVELKCRIKIAFRANLQ